MGRVDSWLVPRSHRGRPGTRTGHRQSIDKSPPYGHRHHRPAAPRHPALVELKDFVIPNTDLIPEDVRSKVKKWSDYIDYWAVDWDFQNDTFMQGWVTYRTRQDRTLAPTSDPHTYDAPGKYRLPVKAIDIFGNDTSQAFEVEVS